MVTPGNLSTAVARLATAKHRGVSTAGEAVCKIHIPAAESIAAQGSARDFFTIAFSLLANYWKHKMSEAYGLRDRRSPEKMQKWYKGLEKFVIVDLTA